MHYIQKQIYREKKYLNECTDMLFTGVPFMFFSNIQFSDTMYTMSVMMDSVQLKDQ